MPDYATKKIAVLTVKPEEEFTDWSQTAVAERKWGVKGILLARSDSHGLVYQIRHQDGTSGWYEPRELRILDPFGEPMVGPEGELTRDNDHMEPA